MSIDPSRFVVEQVIVHEVPRRHDGAGPTLSEVSSPLNADIKTFFKDRISASLVAASHEASFDPASTSPVPDAVQRVMSGGPAEFVSLSQQMAQHLFNSQPAISNAGLLTVVGGRVQQGEAVALLKLQKEEGVQVDRVEQDGLRTLSVRHLQGLMLTGNTKVFKVGLFVRTNSGIEARVSDHQRSLGGPEGVADFFLKAFLGCCLTELPAVRTQRFHQVSERFFNEQVSDPVLRTQYHVHLMSELLSQRPVVRPSAFAANHLEVEHRPLFKDYLRDAAISLQEITKDTTLIASRLRKVQMEFESGISVVASPEAMEAHVEISEVSAGQTSVSIVDKLSKVKGRS